MDTVYEGTTSYLTVSFFDKAGAAAAPSAATWLCHDVHSGTVLKEETALEGVAASVEITIPPSVNTMVDQYAQQEQHRVTVVASYGADDQVTAMYDFLVTGLRQVT